ncbi:MAG: CHAT domain-containing protein, partial [Prevotellaceae bacterium]|nr:CHAT domain-containing protein [Prevotellaceae bacterium]
LSVSTYQTVVGELLQPDEIFIQFRDVYVNAYEYVAIVVDPEADNTVVTYLFESSSLHPFAREDCTNARLGQLVWGPLQEAVQGKRNIYFSASGELYNYPIEYLLAPDDTSMQMNEEFNMYRLSGIEQLARCGVEDVRQRKAVVFGGLEFDNNAYDTDTESSDLLAFRGALSYPQELPQTQEEVTYIDSLLRQKNVLVSLQTGKSGGKEAFSEVAQSDISLLHLATHGSYDPNLHVTDESQLKKWMLSRTEIYLSGDYNQYSSQAERGLVTGRDIASMDLDNLGLVVLSACQTGLGDVFEGKQYGLPTAFKEAEAKSILGSLWQVDDDATKLLMIRFYSNLTSGLDKLEALKEAQSFVRNYERSTDKAGGYERPYAEPVFWAAFVMLDANKTLYKPVSQVALDFIKQFRDENLLGSFVEQDVEDWQKYKGLLQPEDALIYFYNYTLVSGEDEYVALIYSPECPDGKIVPVYRGAGQGIGRLPLWDDDDEQWWGLADTIYARLEPHISGKTRIFFRPTGMFNSLPIENLLECVHPDLSFYRISSGESLKFLAEERRQPTSALLVGGLDYTYGEKELLPSEGTLCSSGVVYKGLLPLPQTKREVEDADSILRLYMNDVVLLEERDATEKELRSVLSNRQSGVMHLATHGGNLRLEDLLRHKPGKRIMHVKPHPSLRENLLECGFVALSCANINVSAEPEADEDNILSALEVSQMDLGNTDLVVLATSSSLSSASTSCQTFGLAYAFRQAGVKSIMATTDNVSDYATQMLITEFYRQWASGKSKHDALRAAQEYVRDVEDGRFAEIEYWAAFVLMDAIN